MALMTEAEFDQLKVDGWEQIGICGVDHGSLIIADPKYILFDRNPKDLGENIDDFWTRFRERSLSGNQPLAAQWKHDNGRDGLAVSFNTGIGDGGYLVLAKYHDDEDIPIGRRISEIRMIFLAE